MFRSEFKQELRKLKLELIAWIAVSALVQMLVLVSVLIYLVKEWP